MARKFIEAAAVTDPGNVRQYNEDCLAMDPELGIFVVADGMGGHRAGEVASATAAQVVLVGLRERLAKLRSAANQHSPLLAVEESINQANLAIWGAAQGHPRQLGMGTNDFVHLEVPAYFDYLLPEGAPLPPCDPRTTFTSP